MLPKVAARIKSRHISGFSDSVPSRCHAVANSRDPETTLVKIIPKEHRCIPSWKA